MTVHPSLIETPLTDAELLERALRKFRTKRNLAKYLGVTPQSVSNYGSAYPVPRHVRRILEMELDVAPQPTTAEQPGEAPR